LTPTQPQLGKTLNKTLSPEWDEEFEFRGTVGGDYQVLALALALALTLALALPLTRTLT